MNFAYNLKSISKTYGNNRQILDDLNLSGLYGSITAVVGASGCGKTTLLNIVGLLDMQFNGDIQLCGVDVKRFSDRKRCLFRNENIGFIFQDYGLLPNAKVKDSILMSSWYGVHKKSKIEQNYALLIDSLGLKPIENERTVYLSGGEKQRVAIARALLLSPSIILADEPTGNLDEENTKIIFEHFKTCANKNKAVLLVTHNISLARKADEAYYLQDGKLRTFYA
ncbi:MAG: ABC transporter ATP-binding protein [Christensenellales bacterium]|jgi:ABC-type lipoprotein export system ATPase subunit